MNFVGIVKRMPAVGGFAKIIYILWRRVVSPFKGSEDYWKMRYEKGGTSGCGSYSKLAEFKAEVINDFVGKNNIEKVIEFGSGDGNQLRLMSFDKYIGFDISERAIDICKDAFASDTSKQFRLYSSYGGERADLSLSLDVIYHLVEDSVYEGYMERLFSSSDRYVVIYSSNIDEGNKKTSLPHVRHREFARWVEINHPEWRMERHIVNKYPYTGDDMNGSLADFFIYSKVA